MVEISKTTNYEMFKGLAYNRPIKKAHVRELKIAIETRNKLSLHPIVVSKNMEVIDGQHRLEAAKELGVPVYYVIDNDESPETIIALNTNNRTWVTDDYLNYYVERGVEDYIKLAYFCKTHQVSIGTALSWLGCSTNLMIREFKNGRFEYEESEQLQEWLMLKDKVITILQDNNYRPPSAYKSTAFNRALFEFLTSPLVEPIQFCERLNRYIAHLKLAHGKDGWIKSFIDVYNIHRRNQRLLLSDRNEMLLI